MYNYLVEKYSLGYHGEIEEQVFVFVEFYYAQVDIISVVFSITLFDNKDIPLKILRSDGSVS